MQVTIEPIKREHAKDTWYWRNDPVLWEYTPCDTPLPASLRSEEQCYIYKQQDNSNRMFAIMYDGEAVGAVTLKSIGHGTAAIGYYVLRKDLWGKGICRNAVSLAIDYAFNEFDLDLVYVWVNSDNTASFKVARALGFYSVGLSFTNTNVHRMELTKTVWKRK